MMTAGGGDREREPPEAPTTDPGSTPFATETEGETDNDQTELFGTPRLRSIKLAHKSRPGEQWGRVSTREVSGPAHTPRRPGGQARVKAHYRRTGGFVVFEPNLAGLRSWAEAHGPRHHACPCMRGNPTAYAAAAPPVAPRSLDLDARSQACHAACFVIIIIASSQGLHTLTGQVPLPRPAWAPPALAALFPASRSCSP